MVDTYPLSLMMLGFGYLGVNILKKIFKKFGLIYFIKFWLENVFKLNRNLKKLFFLIIYSTSTTCKMCQCISYYNL